MLTDRNVEGGDHHHALIDIKAGETFPRARPVRWTYRQLVQLRLDPTQ